MAKGSVNGAESKRHSGNAGVSTATVSLVLNNKPGVGEKRRQEIIQKIKEMDCGYMLKEQRINNVQGTSKAVAYLCGMEIGTSLVKRGSVKKITD